MHDLELKREEQQWPGILDEKAVPHQRFNPSNEREWQEQLPALVSQLRQAIFLQRIYTLIQQEKDPKLQVLWARCMIWIYSLFESRGRLEIELNKRILKNMQAIAQDTRQSLQSLLHITSSTLQNEDLDSGIDKKVKELSQKQYSKIIQCAVLESKLGVEFGISNAKALMGFKIMQIEQQFSELFPDPTDRILKDLNLKRDVQSSVEAYKQLCQDPDQEGIGVFLLNEIRSYSSYSSNSLSPEVIRKGLADQDMNARREEIIALCEAVGGDAEQFLQLFSDIIEVDNKYVRNADVPSNKIGQVESGISANALESLFKHLSKEAKDEPEKIIYDCMINMVPFVISSNRKVSDHYKARFDIYLRVYNKFIGANLTFEQIISIADVEPLPSIEIMMEAADRILNLAEEQRRVAQQDNEQKIVPSKPLVLPPLSKLIPDEQLQNLHLQYLEFIYKDILFSRAFYLKSRNIDFNDFNELVVFIDVAQRIVRNTDNKRFTLKEVALDKGLELIDRTDNLGALANFVDNALLKIENKEIRNKFFKKARQRGLELVRSEIFGNKSLTLERRKELLVEYRERDIFKIRRNQSGFSVHGFLGMPINTQKAFTRMIMDINEEISKPERSYEMQPMQNPRL